MCTYTHTHSQATKAGPQVSFILCVCVVGGAGCISVPRYSLSKVPLPKAESIWSVLAHIMGLPGGSVVKYLHAIHETQIWSLGWEDPLEKGMATHPSILAWEIPWTEEPGGLQSMGCQESDTSEGLTLAHISAFDYQGWKDKRRK